MHQFCCEKDALAVVVKDATLAQYYGIDFCVLSYQKLNTPFSAVYKLLCKASDRTFTLYLKTLCQHPIPEKAMLGLKSEFEVMRQLNQLFADSPRLNVPNPVKFYPETLSLLTEEVIGGELETLFSGAALLIRRAPLKKALEMAELAGMWLKQFQLMTKNLDMAVSHIALADYCQERLDSLIAKQVPGVTKDMTDQLYSLAEMADRQIIPEHIFYCGCHGDFAPHNIITDRQSLSVLDFTDYRLDINLFDPINFMEKVGRMHGYFRYRHAVVEQLNHHFLQGYGLLSEDVVDSASYRLIRARCVLLRIFNIVLSDQKYSPQKRYNSKMYSESLAEFKKLLDC
ncbi:phosphotransferase [Alishewanella sp. HH-ZS]|uniref:phosphotransferase n=1 Tax=Alishewanella sp. HH-ZS TaxID=1856684 RepID=UPI0011474609|nr:phosphotransferase [Alishewanella sp. HH-ZS]